MYACVSVCVSECAGSEFKRLKRLSPGFLCSTPSYQPWQEQVKWTSWVHKVAASLVQSKTSLQTAKPDGFCAALCLPLIKLERKRKHANLLGWNRLTSCFPMGCSRHAMTKIVFRYSVCFADGEKTSPVSPVFNPPRIKFPKHITNPMDDKFEVGFVSFGDFYSSDF